MQTRLMDEKAAPFILEGGEHAVLLIHGFTGTPANLRPLGERLHQAGYTVQAVLLPGHGTSIEDMIARGRAAAWRGAAVEAYQSLVRRYATVSVMGLSMGGTLSLILAEQEPAPACLVTFAAAMRLQNRLSFLSPLLGRFIPVFRESVPRQRKEVDFLREYDIGYADTPVRCVSELRKLIREAQGNLGRITCPTLIVQSRADPTVQPVSAQLIFDGIHSGKKSLLWLEESGHVVTLGPEREQVFESSLALLRQVTGQGAP